jgi:hypothetical protein
MGSPAMMPFVLPQGKRAQISQVRSPFEAAGRAAGGAFANPA